MASKQNTYGWHTVIVLFIRTVEGFAYPKRLSADARTEIDETVGSRARVRRPSLVAHVMPTGNGRSQFARMTPVTASQVQAVQRGADASKFDDDTLELLQRGFVVPGDSLGRGVNKSDWEPDHSTGESIRLWLKQRVAPSGLVHGEDVSIAIVPVSALPKGMRP